ncbi:MAG TPA: hypothetical protein VEB21_03835 [Terriglobales bacterium]|nr:hypothetical protein [Terriglobales bacterium]
MLRDLDWRLIGGAIGLCVYVLALLVPPGPTLAVTPAADATLLQRLFADVPTWWVAGRLLALFLGAALLAARLPVPRPHWSAAAPLAASGAAVWVGLPIAVTVCGLGLFAGVLPRWGQLAYLVSLGAPAAATILARGARRPGLRRPLPRETWICAALLSGWVALTLATVWRDPRVASIGDLWYLYDVYLQFLADGTNFLTSWHQQLVAAVDMIAAGGTFYSAGEPPSVQSLQTVGVGWAAASAALTAWAIARLLSPRSAPLAMAAVLGSPILLSMTHWPFPFTPMLTLAAALLALVVHFAQTRSLASFLLLAAVAGVTGTQGYGAFAAPPAVLAAWWIAWRRPRLPLPAFLTFVMTLVAAVLPPLPAVEIDSFRSEMSGSAWPWAEVEMYANDQRAPLLGERLQALEKAGRSLPLDHFIGGALAPFASPRTAIRLVGDALLEPCSAALTAVGLLLCLRAGRRRWQLGACAAAWLFLQLPMMVTSNYDRISTIRNLPLPIASAFFAAIAFEGLLLAFPRRRATAVPAAAAVLSLVCGLFLHHRINPHILASSAMEILLEASDHNRSSGGAVVLELLEGTEYLSLRSVASFPDPPLPVIQYLSPLDLKTDGQPIADLFLWSPGLEEECDAARAICTSLPAYTVFTLRSRSRLSQAFAAARSDRWQPKIAPQRWTARSCATFTDPYPGEPRRRLCTPDRIGTGDGELAYRMLGGPALLQGDLQQADDRLANAMAAASADPEEKIFAYRAETWNAVGVLRALQGRDDEARQALLQARQSEPSYAAAENNLGVMAVLGGDAGSARQHLERSLTVDDRQAAAHYNYAIISLFEGRRGDAATHFERADQLLPESRRAGARIRAQLVEMDPNQLRFEAIFSAPAQQNSVDFYLALSFRGSER